LTRVGTQKYHFAVEAGLADRTRFLIGDGMKLASFVVHGTLDGSSTWGLIEGDSAFDLGSVLGKQYVDLKSLVSAGAYDEVAAARPRAQQYPLDRILWLPVIPNPNKIFCVGLNYEMHRKETGRAVVEHPTIFGRFANTQTAHLQPIRRPRVSTDFDFEGELALVIGKPGRYIAREAAWEHDGSIRDWQHHTHQFTPGKNFPETGSFGPWIMTPDELGDLSGLRIQTRLNGAVVQDALLGQMIFDIPTIIEYCSSFNRLESGDVIVTGTPGGVGVKRTPQLWMKPGDIVEVEIDRLGTLRNSIADED
jgi:2-keto-4-pentenoate hydratase/2-oxohepta-3-ene-1,7-dioic acid hydratase in catechol pathway